MTYRRLGRGLGGAHRAAASITALALVALSLTGCGTGAEETPVPIPEDSFDSVVSVTGEVVPAEWATLSFRTGGVVAAVPVETVEKGVGAVTDTVKKLLPIGGGSKEEKE